MNPVERAAPAKINLTLRAGGIRPDGYHEIESLVARVGLHDNLTFAPRPDGQFTLHCDDPFIPSDPSNLALRAARALSATVARPVAGIEMRLAKRIPAGAGLGGGSSDAATTLMVLNELWSSGLNRAELSAIAAGIGSDVPLFLAAPLCVVRGRGVEIEDVAFAARAWVVLVLPPIHSGTAAVYAAFDRLNERAWRPPLAEICAALDSGPVSAMELFYNDLEPAAHLASPALAQFASKLRAAVAVPFRMSGSGSAYFTITYDEHSARSIAAQVQKSVNVRCEAVPFSTDEPS